jgi:hypothetical protein
MIIVPNNKVASSIVTNYHLPEKEMAVLVDVDGPRGHGEGEVS